MSKKRFIQAVIIRSLPEMKKLASAIHYAEFLWDGLNQHGYGADKKENSEHKDWYEAMSLQQKKSFNQFWQAFQYKQGRNGAAMRWYQLGAMNPQQTQIIINAATKEAQKNLADGQARKMAQGWLHEKRYQDTQPSQTNQKDKKRQHYIRLNNELKGLKSLYEASGDEALLTQIERLEKAVRDVRAKQ